MEQGEGEPGWTGSDQLLCDHPSLHCITGGRKKKVLSKKMAGISLLTQIPHRLCFWLTFNQNQKGKGILEDMVSRLTSFMKEKQTQRSFSIHFFNCSKFRRYRFNLMLFQPVPKHITGGFVFFTRHCIPNSLCELMVSIGVCHSERFLVIFLSKGRQFKRKTKNL